MQTITLLSQFMTPLSQHQVWLNVLELYLFYQGLVVVTKIFQISQTYCKNKNSKKWPLSYTDYSLDFQIDL